MADVRDLDEIARVRALADDPASGERLESYVLCLLDETHAEVKNADTKTSILFGFVGAAVAFLASALLDDSSALSNAGDAVIVISIMALGAFMAALVMLALSLTPRLGHPTPGKARYFGELALFSDADSAFAVLAEDAADAAHRHAEQLVIVSGIAVRKYQHLRRAMYSVSAAMLLLGAAALVSVFD